MTAETVELAHVNRHIEIDRAADLTDIGHALFTRRRPK
jgi:hypothetical protein